jgi:CRP/FNR family transcriptional regulator
VGAVSVFARDFSLPATLQAIVDSEVLVFAPGVVRSMALADALVADAVLAELSERVQAFIIELRMSAFAPVRQRVARHILDLASESQQSATLVANVNQTELAAACGTVREGVARVLSAFRNEDLVVTSRGGILILQVQAIAGIAMGEDEHRA